MLRITLASAYWFAGVLLSGSLSAQSAHDPVPDVAIGKRIFESQCTVCHGQNGTGGRGPSLTRAKLSKVSDDKSLRAAIAQGLPPEMPGSWQLSVREVASVAAYVRALGSMPQEVLPGDATRGAAVYRRKGCSGCHIVAGQGSGRGPELTAIGARRSGAFLRESLRSPAASLPDDYMVIQAVTASGVNIRGVRANEDPFTLQVWDAATGALHSLRKPDLTRLLYLPAESTMPAFPEAVLPAAELDDLVAYLASLKGESQ
jgi:putative heme-binding domain-containing protein